MKLCRLAECDFTYFMNDADKKINKGGIDVEKEKAPQKRGFTSRNIFC